MEQLQPIYKGRDLYVPAFEVKVSGSSLPNEVVRDVIEVTYKDTVEKNKFDTFEITINNWDDEKLDFKYTGFRDGTADPQRDELFDPGQDIELWMGYFSPMGSPSTQQGPSERLRLMLTGTITKLAPTFPAGGKPTLKISGPNILIKMIDKQETHTYRDKLRDSEIAMEVGQRNKLTLNGQKIPVRIDPKALNEEPPTTDLVLQDNQFDILFLFELAHRNGYEVVLKLDENTDEPYLYFGPSTQDVPLPYLLEWGKSLVQFQPTISTGRQVNQLTIRSWNIRTKKPIEVTVKRDELSTRPLEDEARLYRLEQGFQDRREIIVEKPFRSKAEAKREAKAMLKKLKDKMITAQGSTVGTPDLRAGKTIQIGGLGRTFDGKYFLESTTHTIGTSGYTTSFKARKEVENS